MAHRGQETVYYKISEACKILGVKEGILRKWDSQGNIKTIRTPGGIRLFDITSVDPTTNLFAIREKKEAVAIFYSRVSSSKQKDDLERQKQFLKDNYADKYPRFQEVTDIGSGLNFKRTGLLRVLGLIKEGNVSAVVVASKDRLARFGFELIEWLCKEYGTETVVLDNQDSTPEEELGNDLMSIVQVYCCRWNGKRRYKAKNKGNEAKVETDAATKEKA